MTHPIRLREEWPGDLTCPHCKARLTWDEDNLYDYNLEKVQCGQCEGVFYAKRTITYDYEVMRD